MTRAYVDESAQLGARCSLGQHVVIEPDAVIGDDVTIGHHVVIRQGSRIGNNVRIDDHTVIGKLPMRAKLSAVTTAKEREPAVICDNCILGTGSVIYVGCSIAAAVLVADLATIREDVTVGAGTIVGRGVTIENQCAIGKKCKLETNVYVTAFSTIEDRVFMAPGVVTSNDNFVGRTEERFKHFKGVTVKKGARIGVNSTILPGITIAEDALIAAGSIVTKDVPARKIVMGAPARIWKDVPEEQLLENQGWKD